MIHSLIMLVKLLYRCVLSFQQTPKKWYHLYWIVVLNMGSRIVYPKWKNTFCALRSYILTVLSMPAQITRSDVSLKVTAVIWYLHFKSSIGPLFSSLIYEFNSLKLLFMTIYCIYARVNKYFITSITFDNKPSIELNF